MSSQDVPAELPITFDWNGKWYQFSQQVYDDDQRLRLIVLPDGTALEVVDGWNEVSPPSPKRLELYEEQGLTGLNAQEIAIAIGAALASEFDPILI